MITPENSRKAQKLIAGICRESASCESLSELKEKFSAISLDENDITDQVLRISVEKDIGKILSSQTLERARHYARILDETLSQAEDSSGLNPRLWKGYDHILTDSLWNLGKRVSNDTHKAWYWGNFVPQIPFQLISRYTAQGDWVLDPFLGSGTTVMEALKLGRKSLGIELNPEVFDRVRKNIGESASQEDPETVLFNANSLDFDYADFAGKNTEGGFRLAILHPPYWDIIRFSEDSADLSNAQNLEDFTGRLKALAKRILPAMAPGSHIGLVIGDTYRKGEVIPLGFRSMDALQSLGLALRGIIVKDIQNTRAKRSAENLWRYRALKSGFYVFKHEYVFVFRAD